MCQVDGCNKKGTMVNGIMLTDKTYGSITLDIFICEEHNDDPRFLATEWISSIRSFSEMITGNIDVEREPRVKERRKPRIEWFSRSRSSHTPRQHSPTS